jgi:gamma-glutamyl-gamma-aminobutyrate hydrolase PuuD
MNKEKSAALKIGVTMRVDICQDTGERRDSIDQRLLKWVQAADGIPQLIPNNLRSVQSARQWLNQSNVNAIVLSGGNDFGDAVERDETEFSLLGAAEDRGIPVLGICRGMQILAIYFGVGLTEVRNHVRTRHQIHGELDLEVNSFHRYGIEACPPDFSVLAVDDGGAIEAIKHNVLPWEGWMWHPERETAFRKIELDRLRSLIRNLITPCEQ